jgi:SSS family solute:Na+ symporter
MLPLMLVRYCGPGLLGLGITALIAGFMSGMAGNVSAFSDGLDLRPLSSR